MYQVIYNLVNNALKYTQEKGDIRIEFTENKNQVIMSVTDNGHGIPSEELPFIFERFYRADKSRNRDTGGSGIGLAIVKSIIHAHHGEIEAESKLNEGSSFTIKLPRKTLE
jgi:signal transduction histidine kinase